jgi:hypothetical protein
VSSLRLLGHDRTALVAGLVGPLIVAAVLLPFRGHVANTDVALVLVLVIVGVAAAGCRVGGLLAAVSAAVWFDFFWTQPFETVAITTRTDVETAVLLLLIGVAVTEIAAWGWRQHAAAGRESGYRDGILAAAEAAASGASPSVLIDRVCEQLGQLLGLRLCRFDYGTGLGYPRLEHDGTVVWRHRTLDADATGLPDGRPTELIVESGGHFRGRFLLSPRPGVRPTRAERLVAVGLADQVGAALAGYEAGRS